MTLRTPLAAFAALAMLAAPALAAELPYSAEALAAAQAQGRPVVVHVTAPWCSTCQAQKPIVAALLAEPKYKDVTVFDVDFDSSKPLLHKLGVRMQSTFIAYHGATETARSSGDTAKASVARLFAKAE